MIKSTSILLEELKNYQNPMVKIAQMVKKNQLIPITRGLYETDPSISGHYLASAIYGPSYLSFEYALAFHGLIPEAVYQFTCATYNKRRRKKYSNHFGHYSYRDVPKLAFPLATVLYHENGYSFIIAKPEKAICDSLYTYEPCSNQKELKSLLFDFLRIDEDVFYQLDLKLMKEIAQYYHTKNSKLLVNILEKEALKLEYLTSTND